MNYIYFIDNFYSNLYYKNVSSSHFQPLSDMSLWSAYNGPDIYRCPIRWRTYKSLRKSTHLHNKINAREEYSLNRYDICN